MASPLIPFSVSLDDLACQTSAPLTPINTTTNPKIRYFFICVSSLFRHHISIVLINRIKIYFYPNFSVHAAQITIYSHFVFCYNKIRNNRFRIFNCQRTKTMRYSSLLALCAFMLCLNVPEVRGEILAVHTYDVMTHTALLPKPVASDNTFSLAATWWLPDWQGGQGSRGSDDAGGGDHNGNCEKNYGMYTPSNIDGRYICSKYNYNVTSSLKCHVNCRCKDEYKYTSSNCSGNYTTAGTSCEGKYNQCVCKSEFKYNSSNCSGEYEVSGTSCGGKYNSCTLRPDCTVSPKDCTYGCAEYNSCDRCTSCKSNPDCSATAVSCDYGCASTNSCGICTSCSGNPDCDVADKSCDYGCAATNSCGKCTSCKSCTPSANETGCTDGTESCSDGCGGTRLCCKGHTHSYSCPSGSQSSSCSSSQVQTGTTSKVCSCGAASGTCYSCRAKTCSDGGYYSSAMSGYSCSKTTYAGLSCYDCTFINCRDYGYQESPTPPPAICLTVNVSGKTCYECQSIRNCSGGAPQSPCSCGGYHSGWSGGHVCR